MSRQTNQCVLVKWDLMIIKNMRFHQFRASDFYRCIHDTRTHTRHSWFIRALNRFHLQFTHSMREKKIIVEHVSYRFCKSVYFWSNAFFKRLLVHQKWLVFAVANCNLSIYKFDDWFGDSEWIDFLMIAVISVALNGIWHNTIRKKHIRMRVFFCWFVTA